MLSAVSAGHNVTIPRHRHDNFHKFWNKVNASVDSPDELKSAWSAFSHEFFYDYAVEVGWFDFDSYFFSCSYIPYIPIALFYLYMKLHLTTPYIHIHTKKFYSLFSTGDAPMRPVSA